MQLQDNVSHWIADLRNGNPIATEHIFNRYFEKVVRLARNNLRSSRRRVVDEEDVALEAMGSFFRGAAEGRFREITNPQDLWGLLATITIRKAAVHVRNEHRLKRGGGRVRGESIFFGEKGDTGANGLDNSAGGDPTPETVTIMRENCTMLLDLLPDDILRDVALRKLQGYSNKEIARRIGRVEETVYRKIRRIREIWSRELSK